jgi:Uncharacterized protein conserved in bacteria (DUF2330)
MQRVRDILILVAVGAAITVVAAGPAAACGSLVAPNGAVRLIRTTTLAAWHDGVEHYVTNFEFASNQASFGSIVPLPGNPTDVRRGGRWTLQRLEREVNPPIPVPQGALTARASSSSVEVLKQVTIDSLQVTILRGGGADVGQWAAQQGFTLTKDTPAVLEFYSQRSPYFMAAKFDAQAAAARGFNTGDGVPVQLTIPTPSPWVPLRILATGKPADEVVQADVFLLTDRKPALLSGPGVRLEQSFAAPTSLLSDLRSDTATSWVPSAGWLSYIKVAAPAGSLVYDLATDVSGSTPRLVDTGLVRSGGLHVPGARTPTAWPWQATLVIVVSLLVGAAAIALLVHPPRRFQRP